MKIVVGLDHFDEARRAVEFVGALKFKDPSADLLHVIERIGAPVWEHFPDEQLGLINRILKGQEVEARNILLRGAADFARVQITVKSKIITGFSAAKHIMAYADQSEADLIAIGSQAKGRVEGLMVGSVGRKLAIGARQSVLVAKGGSSLDGPITAVFATDHSEYANRYLEALLKFAPSGIQRLIVLTAFPKNLIGAMRGVMENFSIDVSTWVEEKLYEHNKSAIEKLRPLGWQFESRVMNAPVNDAIKQAMQEFNAQLLIVGAHGHGFFERMMLGSIALHQVVAEPHSVLILREQYQG